MLGYAAKILGYFILIAMIVWMIGYVYGKYHGTPVLMVNMQDVRTRIVTSVASVPVSSLTPGLRQEDLLALRTRVQSQFR